MSSRAAFLLVALFAVLAGCSTTKAPAVAPCVASLGDTSDSADLTLVGTGSCTTTLRLGLRIATGSAKAPTWTDAAASPLHVNGAWQLQGTFATRSVTVVNTGAAAETLIGLEWATDSKGLGLSTDRLLHDGYQSWNYSGVESIPAQLTDVDGTAPHGGDNEDSLDEIAGVSWWWTAVSDADGHGIVAGADGGTVLKTYLAIDGSTTTRMRIVQGVTGDAIVLQPGESKTLDGLVVALGDVSTNLDAYTHYVGSLHPAVSPRHPPLGGWGSWNMYYTSITSGSLASESTWASTNLAPHALGDFLLDDGYETHWGSWMASPAFGASLQSVATSETTEGLTPAIWLAPFYVDTTDPLIAAHPDWFVHSADGSLRTYNNFGPISAALDVTNPDARSFVVQAIQQLRTWGFRTLKVDFLFGGALEGVRQQPLTSLESYALWMKTLREAVPDMHIVGCGAPMLPSVGWVDSMRIGPDIAYTTNPVPGYNFFSAEARHVAMRASTDAWWALDPDVVLLRGQTLTDNEAWTVVVYSALAGGNYLLGDGQQAGALRQSLALAPEILEMTRDGIAARAKDLVANVDPKLFPTPLLAGNATTAVPHVWSKTSSGGARTWLAVFAWATDGFSVDLSLPANAIELVPPSAPGALARQAFGGARTVTVPAHGARLFVWNAP